MRLVDRPSMSLEDRPSTLSVPPLPLLTFLEDTSLEVAKPDKPPPTPLEDRT